eukprot:gene14545-17188_t
MTTTNPKYENGDPTAFLTDWNPADALGRAALGKEWPLEGEDYITLIRGGLCSIPVVGAAIDCVFGLIWGKIFPKVDPYLRKEDFEKRMNQLIKDMEVKIGKAVDEEVVNWCKLKYETVCTGGFNFREAELLYKDEKAKGKVSDAVKMLFVSQHSVYKHVLEESLIFFSRPDKIHLLGKIYLQTAFLYIAFLRDTHFFGIEWGLPEGYIKGTTNGVVAMNIKVHNSIVMTLNNYKLFLDKIEPFCKKVNKYPFDQLSPSMLMNPPTNTLYPDWSILIASLIYGDITVYPKKHFWINHTVGQMMENVISLENGLVMSNDLDCIMSVDPQYFQAKSQEGFGYAIDPVYNQVVDYTVGTKGIGRGSKGIFYAEFANKVKRNVQLRVYSTVSGSNADTKMNIELIGTNQSSITMENILAGKPAETKKYSETLTLSNYASLKVATSKSYVFEENTTYYFQVEINGKFDEFRFLSLELICSKIK